MPPLHGAVHRLGVVGVVALGARGVERLVGRLVVGLLEEDVGADARVAQAAVVLDRRGGDVHVHAADGAVAVADRVDGVDGFEDVLQRVVARVLARFERQALVTHVLERRHLAADLLLRQLATRDVLVL